MTIGGLVKQIAGDVSGQWILVSDRTPLSFVLSS